MNEGFEWQLKLYQAVGYDVDPSNAIYKQSVSFTKGYREVLALSLSTFFFLVIFQFVKF